MPRDEVVPPDRTAAPAATPGPTAIAAFNPTPEASGISHGSTSRRRQIQSSQVSWWAVHECVQPYLDAAGPLPMAGSPQWCDLDDTDPVKVAALFDAAQHWALRVETCQEHLAEASRDISVGLSGIAGEISRRRENYIPREVA
jgi:hypothetical protein